MLRDINSSFSFYSDDEIPKDDSIIARVPSFSKKKNFLVNYKICSIIKFFLIP